MFNKLTQTYGAFYAGVSFEKSKICSMNWGSVCLPKEEEGLGAKTLELFNLVLLSKWRCIFESNNI